MATAEEVLAREEYSRVVHITLLAQKLLQNATWDEVMDLCDDWLPEEERPVFEPLS